MMEFADVRFGYEAGSFSLHVAELIVPRGRPQCWVGPSGTGKTTLLHLAAGILTPASGRVNVDGTNLSRLTVTQRRELRITRMGLIFQDFALLDYLRVLENILLPYRLHGELTLDQAARSHAGQLAEKLGIGHLLGRRPTQISQGERQRVAVCRALVTKPGLVLADEPTANLDQANADRVWSALESYAREADAGLVVVSHDRDVTARFDEHVNVANFCQRSEVADAR